MVLFNQIQKISNFFFNFIFSINFIIVLVLLVFLYHILAYFTRDRKYIGELKKYKPQKKISLDNLNELPLVNLIIPAWKEGKIFEKCLLALKRLEYPNLNIIINAGGSEETIIIANTFKKYDFFTILYQKAGEGKIKAINDCLKHVSKGFVYIIDADIILNDPILIHMLYILINENEDIVVSPIKPANSIKNKDLVKFAYINRNSFFDHKFSRYSYSFTQLTGMKYKVIKSIDKFVEGRLADDGTSMGMDVLNKNFKIFYLFEQKVESFNYPTKQVDYFSQNLRWIENYLYNPFINRNIRMLKFFIVALVSIYFYLLPLSVFFNIFIFFFGMIFLFSIYMKKLRKILFFKITNKSEKLKLKPIFFIKLIFYLYIDFLINIISFSEMLFYRKAYKKRKNLM